MRSGVFLSALRKKPLINLISNGTFDDSSGWGTYLTTWTFSGGQVSCDTTTNAAILQDIGSKCVVGALYRMSITISGYVRGTPRAAMGGSANVVDLPAADGTHTINFTAGSGDTLFTLYSGYIGIGGAWTADDLHVYRVE